MCAFEFIYSTIHVRNENDAEEEMASASTKNFHILSFPLDSTIHYPNRPPNVNDDECNGCSQMHISLCFIVCSHFDLLPWTTKKSEQKRETSEHDMLHAFDKNENFGLSVQDEMRHLTSPN